FHFQPSFSVTVFVSTTVPFFNRLILISFGLFPSWLLLSFQVLLPSTSVFSGSLVFVTVKPSFALPVTLLSYPFPTASSFTVYSIFFPALYSSRSVKLPVQLFASVKVRVLSVGCLSANNLTVTLAGLTPSWLFLIFPSLCYLY
ncbi:conserved domain protein, partial [Parvimonas sp. oral taxon 393 str. F0440]